MGDLTDPDAKAELLLEWPTYVLGQLWRRGRRATEEALAADGLSLRDYLVLVWISVLRGPSQQEIADRVGIDRSDFVKILDQLQDRELIGRERDPADRRRHVLSLTPGGRDTLARATANSRHSTETFFAALSPQELATLHRLALKALGEDQDLAGLRTSALTSRQERLRTGAVSPAPDPAPDPAAGSALGSAGPEPDPTAGPAPEPAAGRVLGSAAGPALEPAAGRVLGSAAGPALEPAAPHRVRRS